MVNTEEFIRRLELILDYYAVSASVFADTIGVQRSGLSHLLSGRNKPSLDFIMKIVERYPEVDIYWLLNGKGNFPKENTLPANPTQPAPSPAPIQTKQENTLDLFTTHEREPEPDDTTERENDNYVYSNEKIYLSGDIESIVVFYRDGTFKNYKPK